MAFNLRSQSPLQQGRTLGLDLGKSNSFYNKTQSSLAASNKNIKKIDPQGKKTNKGIINDDDTVGEYMDKHPFQKAAIQIADPTGVSSYSDVKKAWSDKKFDKKDVLEPLGALPVLGGAIKTVVKGLQLAKSTKAAITGLGALSVANRVGQVTTAGDALESKESPLRKQKLSPKAAKAKAKRDLAAAKTPDRRSKKAESQRMHRKDPSGKGKDWDHEDGRWESVKQNRGNEGEGTKKESGKKYKVTKARK